MSQPKVNIIRACKAMLLGMAVAASGPLAAEDRSPSDYDLAEQVRASELQAILDDRGSAEASVIALWAPEGDAAKRQFTANLGGASAEQLLALTKAGSAEEVQAIILGGGSSSTAGDSAFEGPLDIGDTTQDWVYTAVQPCRIVDTRNAVGRFNPEESRDYYVYGFNTVSQGGSNCSETIKEPRAAHVNVTVIPSGIGNVRAYPAQGSVPNASLVNVRPGTNIANAAIIKTLYEIGPGELGIYSSNSAHIVIDVLGYFYDVPNPPVIDADYIAGQVATPTSTTAWLADPVTVTVESTSNAIHVVSHAAYGAAGTAAGSLDVYPCYRVVGSVESPTAVGLGIFDFAVAANQRIPIGISGVIKNRSPGNYEVGMCGDDDGDGNWTNNQWGYTSATVLNPLYP